MTSVSFLITTSQLAQLLNQYKNTGKNSDVGNFAVAVAKLYFLSLDSATTFGVNRKGVDLLVNTSTTQTEYEIKGTTDTAIAWPKLKVSSRACHDKLVAGMQLIRVCGIGSLAMTLHFMRYGQDFTLQTEDRWSIRPLTPLALPNP